MGEERATVKHGSRYGRDSLTDVTQQRKERVGVCSVNTYLKIVELFGQKVDLDEVKRMSNGKWVCLICHWRPVLDTVEVLMVHRNSKKHKAQVEARKHKEHETEEKKLQQKRPIQQITIPQTYPTDYQNQYYNTIGYYNYYQYPGYQSNEQYSYPYIDNTQYYSDTTPSNDNATQNFLSNSNTQTPPKANSIPSTQPSKKTKTTPFSYEEFMKDVEWNKWATLCKQKGWTLDDDNKMKKVEGVEFDSDDDEPPTQPKGEIPTNVVNSLKRNAAQNEKGRK